MDSREGSLRLCLSIPFDKVTGRKRYAVQRMFGSVEEQVLRVLRGLWTGGDDDRSR